MYTIEAIHILNPKSYFITQRNRMMQTEQADMQASLI